MAEIISLEIKPADPIIYLGDTVQFHAIATYDDDTVSDITNLVEWSIDSSPEIAEFSETTKGLLASALIGTANIYADYGGSPVYSTTLIIHNPLIVPQSQDLIGTYRPVKEDYSSLLTSQYQTSVKAKAWVESYLQIVQDIREFATSMQCYFSLLYTIIDPNSSLYQQNAWTVKQVSDFVFQTFEPCAGDQLDIIGEILGQSRIVYLKADDEASPPLPAASVELDDDIYKTLLKNRIIINTWDGKTASLQSLWKTLFPDGKIIVQDNQNMTVSVIITGALDSTLVRLIQNDYIVPRPQGVQMTYSYGNLPIFGFGRDDEYISGFDKGYWS